MSLEFVEYPAQGDHKATVIWLHGLGDSGDGFAPVHRNLLYQKSLVCVLCFHMHQCNRSP